MRLKASEGGHGKVGYIRMNPRKALSEFQSQEVVLSDVHGSADDSLLWHARPFCSVECHNPRGSVRVAVAHQRNNYMFLL
jgi:hypothetical protein